VSASEIDRALQDYLDGRMSDDERSAFEARLSTDRDLAERVAFFREVSDGLREADVGLSPGFHARARASFEESQAPRRRWIGPLVWTAGIATAALLTAVVLLPSLTQRDLEEDSTVARLEQRDEEQDEPTSRQKVAPPAATSPKREKSRENAEWADADSAAPVEEGAGAPLASDESRGARKDKLMKQAVAAPRKGADPVLPETADLVLGEAQGVAAEVETAAGSWIQFPVAESFVIPAGRLATGEVRIIDDESEWSEFSDLPAAYSPARRIVLIGPRARPIDCSGIVLRVEVDRRVVLLPPSAGDTAGTLAGCGLQVPADALEIVVHDMPEDGS
jgi:hypothetical protein